MSLTCYHCGCPVVNDECPCNRSAEKRIAELEALLREADNVILWEMHMPNGQDFQRRVEAALGIGRKA